MKSFITMLYLFHCFENFTNILVLICSNSLMYRKIPLQIYYRQSGIGSAGNSRYASATIQWYRTREIVKPSTDWWAGMRKSTKSGGTSKLLTYTLYIFSCFLSTRFVPNLLIWEYILNKYNNTMTSSYIYDPIYV